MATSETVFTIKLGDTRPSITATLRDAEDAVVNLTGCTVALIYGTQVGSGASRKAASVVAPATAGRATYAWVGGLTPDIAAVGEYYAEFEVTYPDGSIQTFPNGGYLTIRVIGDLD